MRKLFFIAGAVAILAVAFVFVQQAQPSRLPSAAPSNLAPTEKPTTPRQPATSVGTPPAGWKGIHQLDLEKAWVAMLDTDPTVPQLSAGIALVANDDWKGANRVFMDAAAQHPSSAAAHFDLGVSFEHVSGLDQAEIELRTAYSLNPNEKYGNELRNARVNRESLMLMQNSSSGR